MWIGAIRLRVRTEDVPNAGTDQLVTAKVLRDSVALKNLALDYPSEDDLERGAVRNYDYIGPTKLGWINDQTPPLPDGVGQSPMPYPSYGIEFSNGMPGHLKIQLEIHGDDMWIKDDVQLFVRQIRRKATSFDTEEWQEDASWSHVGTWSQDVAMSADSDEGVTTWNLLL